MTRLGENEPASSLIFYGEGFQRAEFVRRFQDNLREKQLISLFALSHCVPNGSRLLIDVGTTATVFGIELAESDKTRIHVATHSLTVGLACLDAGSVTKCNVFAGRLFRSEAALIPERMRWPDPFPGQACMGVISVEAFNLSHGACTGRDYIVDLCQRIIARSDEVVVLIDHSKLKQDRLLTISMCGVAGDKSWLTERIKSWIIPRKVSTKIPSRKRCRIILGTLWQEGHEPREYQELIRHPTVMHVEHGTGEFKGIVMLETEIFPLFQE